MEKKCKDLVKSAFISRMKDIKTLYKAEEQTTEELGNLNEYGLCIDFVEAGTFKDQKSPYYRYQISYGGPSEEFRIYLNGQVEFWYLDWFDGSSVEVIGENATIIKDIISPIVTNHQIE